jgi:hypothetical protein
MLAIRCHCCGILASAVPVELALSSRLYAASPLLLLMLLVLVLDAGLPWAKYIVALGALMGILTGEGCFRQPTAVPACVTL